MIKHVVMWKFKPFAEGRTKEENLLLVKSMLEALPEKIDFLRSMQVNLNINPKESMFDAVLLSEFDSLEDVLRYREHPEHKKISSYVALVREARASVDYEEYVKLPSSRPVDMSALSEPELNAELEKGYADIKTGRTKDAGAAFADIRKDYNL